MRGRGWSVVVLGLLGAAPLSAQTGLPPGPRNPVLMDGPAMHDRQLTPAEYRAWMTHPPAMDTDAAVRLVGQVPARAPAAGPLFASGAQGDIYVVEGTNQLVLSVDGNGSPCTGGGCYKVLNPQGAVQAVADAVIRDHGDIFDSVVVWTTFKDYSVAAYYLPLRNDIHGLGVCDSGGGQSSLFGCVYDRSGGQNVQGYIYMNGIDLWLEVDNMWGLAWTELDFESQVYATLGQESAHRWLSGFQVRDTAGRVSTLLLGRDKSHWNLKFDSGGSVMDGVEWEDTGNGTFSAVGDNDGYSALDQYAMGLIAPEEVAPVFFISGAASNDLKSFYWRVTGQTISDLIPDGTEQLPAGWPPHEVMGTITATGSRRDYSIEQIISVNGARVPAYDEAPKQFKQAFALVTLPGQSTASVTGHVARLDAVRQRWEQWFTDRTAARGNICTSLSGVCAPPHAEIADVRLSDDGSATADGAWGRNEEVSLYLVVTNSGGAPVMSVSATASTASERVTVTGAQVQLGRINPGTRVESPTAFRLTLSDRTPCDVTTVPVTVTLDGGAAAREFNLAVKACGEGEQPVQDPTDKDDGGGPGGILPGCACALPATGTPPVAALLLAGAVTRRLRRKR